MRAWLAGLLACFTCAPLLAAPPKQDPSLRPQICLNGEWQFQPDAAKTLAFPPQGAWDKTPIRIPSPWNVNSFSRGKGGDFECFPSYPKSWEGVEAAWQRRVFTAPEAMRGKRVFLRFEAVYYWADVYLNGKLAGSHEGGFTPFELDVTDLIRIGGENELIVGVKGANLFDVNGRTPYGWGSFWGSHIRGIWQDVYLIARPQVYVSDVYVKPSVERMSLGLEVTVCNASEQPWRGQVANAIVPSGGVSILKGLPAQDVELVGGETKTLKWDEPWPEAKLWWPDDPKLYVLNTSLTGSRTEDVKLTRFGFKEFKIGADRRKFTLNGVPFSGRADAWHFMGVPQMSPVYPAAWYKMAKGINVNLIRLHAQIYPEFYMDVADEMGMLIVDETPLWGSGGNFYYNDDFWRRARQVCDEFVMRDRNHPSVAIWSVANEIYFAGDMKTSGAPSQDWIFAHYAELAQRMKALDPTREVSSDGDNDLGGRLPIYSWHYPGPGDPGTPGKTHTIGESGSMFYSVPPEFAYRGGDRAYLSSHDRLDLIGEEEADNIEGYRKWAAYATVFNIAWYGLEPLNFQDVDFRYKDLTTPGMKPERLGAYCTMLNGGRDPKLPEFIPNPVHDHVADAFKPVRFFVRERSQQVYDGAPLVRHFTVHNDGLQASDLTLAWSLRRVGGKDARQDIVKLGKMGAGEMKSAELRCPVPAAQSASGEAVELTVSLLRAGDTEPAYRQVLPLRVYPRTLTQMPIVSGPVGVKVYDPQGKTAQLLEGMRISCVRVTKLDAGAVPPPPGILVIGEGAGVLDEAAQVIEKRLEAGGRVLALAGNPGFGGPGGVMSRAGGSFGIAFAKAPTHPVLRGVTPEMLRYWAPDNGIGGPTFVGIPRYGMTPLVTCRDAETAMLEARVGGGRMILTELPLVARAAQEPTAAVLLRNAVAFVSNAGSGDSEAAACFAGKSSKLTPSLHVLGAAVSDTAAAHTVILDGARPPTDPAEVQRAKQAVEAAKTVVVWNMTPEAQKALAAMLPPAGALKLTKTDAVQLIRGQDDPLLTGVEHADLYGIEKDSVRPVMQYAVDGPADAKRLLVTNHTDWRLWTFEGENIKTAAIIRSERAPFTPQCGLLVMPWQEKRIVINQVLCNPRMTKQARFASQLLTNLDVGIGPDNTKTEDLTAFNVDANGFIASWLLCGAFQAGSFQEALDKDFIGGEADVRPAPGLVSAGRLWYPYLSPAQAVDFAAKDMLGEMMNADVYAATYVFSEQARTANLWLGADDGVKVWVNGKEVLSNGHIGPVEPDQFKVSGIALQPGWNRVVVKVAQLSGNWGLTARFVDATGQPMDDLRIAATPALRQWQELPRGKWTGTCSIGWDPRAALDGDPGTRWTSGEPQKPGEWYQIDMGSQETFARVVLDSAGSPGDYPRGLKMEASDDGAQWREVASLSDTGRSAPGGVLELVLPETTARYIRFTQTGPAGVSNGLYWSIHELRVYR